MLDDRRATGVRLAENGGCRTTWSANSKGLTMIIVRSLLPVCAVMLMVGAITRLIDFTILAELKKERFLKTLYRN
jgi:hypothetical protein